MLVRPVRTDTAWSTLSTPRVVARQVLPGVGLALAQAAALTALAGVVLRLGPAELGSLATVLGVAGAAFALVNQGLAAWLRAPGRVLALAAAAVTVIATLTRTVPDWFSRLAAATPVAPALTGLRDAQVGDALSSPLFTLAAWAIVGLVAAGAAVVRARSTSARDVLRGA